jgi:hypothetical protein
MPEPKKHHYISQFYLAGFSEKYEKDGKLFCYDLLDKKLRISKPINEGYEKYFNRLESNKENLNELEKTLAQCEDIISESFRYIINNKCIPEGKQFQELIYYVSLLGVRNPSIRDTFKEFQNDVYYKALSLTLKDKKDWEEFIKKANKDNDDKYANVTYEDMKDFIKGRQWDIVEPNENKIYREFLAVDSVYQLLMKRNWSLYIIEHSNNYFITSDRPVKLYWNNNANYNFGPSFGDKNSELVFPINNQIILYGSFMKPSFIKNDTLDMEIAFFNTIQLFYYKRHLYSSTEKFIFRNENTILSSENLLIQKFI